MHIYKGNEIGDPALQKKIDSISDSRYPGAIESEHTSQTELEPEHTEKVTQEAQTEYDEDFHCLLGNDWYMFYTIIEDEVIEIDFFESNKDTSDIFKMSIDILKGLKYLASIYENYHFIATLNEFSRPLYEKLLKRRIIDEEWRKTFIGSLGQEFTNVTFLIKPKK